MTAPNVSRAALPEHTRTLRKACLSISRNICDQLGTSAEAREFRLHSFVVLLNIFQLQRSCAGLCDCGNFCCMAGTLDLRNYGIVRNAALRPVSLNLWSPGLLVLHKTAVLRNKCVGMCTGEWPVSSQAYGRALAWHAYDPCPNLLRIETSLVPDSIPR